MFEGHPSWYLQHANSLHSRACQLIRQYRRIVDVHWADDLVQRTLIKAHLHEDAIKTEAKSKHWLYVVLRNEFLMDCRRKEFSLKYFGDLESALPSSIISTNHANDEHAEFDGEGLEIMCHHLSPRHAKVLTMSLENNFDKSAVSAKLNTSDAYVEKLLLESFKFLRMQRKILLHCMPEHAEISVALIRGKFDASVFIQGDVEVEPAFNMWGFVDPRLKYVRGWPSAVTSLCYSTTITPDVLESRRKKHRVVQCFSCGRLLVPVPGSIIMACQSCKDAEPRKVFQNIYGAPWESTPLISESSGILWDAIDDLHRIVHESCFASFRDLMASIGQESQEWTRRSVQIVEERIRHMKENRLD